jgi:hypothetical protein
VDPVTGVTTVSNPITGITHYYTSGDVGPDGTYYQTVGTSTGEHVLVYNPDTNVATLSGTFASEPIRPLGSTSYGNGRVFAPDGTVLQAFEGDGVTGVWIYNPQTDTFVARELTGDIGYFLQKSPTGQIHQVTYDEDSTTVWTYHPDSQTFTASNAATQQTTGDALAFAADGTGYLTTSKSSEGAKIWTLNPSSGQLTLLTTMPGRASDAAKLGFGNQLYLTTSGSSGVDVWSVDPVTGGIVLIDTIPVNSFGPVLLDADGKPYAVPLGFISDGELWVADPARGQFTKHIDLTGFAFSRAQVGPDGTIYQVTDHFNSQPATIFVYNPHTGEFKTFEFQSDSTIRGVLIAPDGTAYANVFSNATGTTVWVYHSESGAVSTLKAGEVELTPDGRAYVETGGGIAYLEVAPNVPAPV